MKATFRCSSIALFLFAPLLLAAQVPTGNITINNRVLKYPISADSLSAVHFRNLKYNLGGDWIQLHNGEYSEKQDFGETDTRIQRVWFFDPKNDEPQQAVVWITQTGCGASCGIGGYALVFEIKDGSLVRIQQVQFDAKDPSAGVQFDPAHAKLVVTAKSQKDAGDCCAAYLDELICTWKDGQFEPTAYRLRLPK